MFKIFKILISVKLINNLIIYLRNVDRANQLFEKIEHNAKGRE